MATWSGSIGPGTDPGTGRSIYLDWTIYSDVDPSYGTTSVAFRLVIYVRTGGQSIDSSNSFTISGDWSRSGSVSINTPSGGGSQLIYDSGYNVVRSGLGWGSTASASFSASLSGVTVVTGTNYPAISGSGSGSVTVPTPTAPGTPGVTVTPNNGSVTVTYSAPADGGTGGVTSYQYYTNLDGTVRDTPSNPFNISAANGTAVTVYVRASNAYLSSGYASASATPRTVPSAPGSFTGTANTFGTVALSWTTPNNNGSALTSYVLTRTNGATTVTLTPPSTSATTYNDTTVAPAVSYTYTLYATNAAGNGTSATFTITSLGGVVNIKKSTTGYDKVVPQVRVGSSWVPAQARIRDNGEWKYGI